MSQQTKSSKTIWSATNKQLLINIICGLESGSFVCPTFGTVHKVHPNCKVFADGSDMTALKYRGNTYGITKIHNNREGGRFYLFGLIVPKTNGTFALKRIMQMAENMSYMLNYNTEGELESAGPNKDGV